MHLGEPERLPVRIPPRRRRRSHDRKRVCVSLPLFQIARVL